ncbi:MAG: SAM-dependent methyltransferase [Nitrososphaera sp.]|nr:SAM-dependent methyltransferase [Nitrososphaera sp.]
MCLTDSANIATIATQQYNSFHRILLTDGCRQEKVQGKKPSKTSDFGVSRRESHDSSKFYSRKIYGSKQAKNTPAKENPVPDKFLDKIFCKTSEKMDELPDSSVHLMITSPPYNVGKTYDRDLTFDEYRNLLKTVFLETHRVLVDDGRICVNIANLGRRPYIPLHAFVISDLLDIGFVMRGEVIWDKASSAGTSTAWGSWQSASNPTLRDVHEYILVFSKGSLSRSKQGKKSTISRQEFLQYTKSVWQFPSESAKRAGHPAPFPVELPHRCIQLYSYLGDTVLDPFCGSGSTCVAAAKTGRRFIGYDTDPEFVEAARKRVLETQKGNMA